jgi:hypothetical protein
MAQYQDLTEDELLNLASEREQLTDEARLALESELGRRKLSEPEVNAYKRQRADDDEAEKLRRAKRQTVRDIGRKFLGKSNRRRDPSGVFELYESTLWFVVLWFPVYPIATYTVRRDLERWLGMTFASDEIALERHPRDWEMILLTWVKASALVLGLRLLYLVMLHHPEWVKRLFK